MCISAKKCCIASAAPRPENSNSHEKNALFGLDTQIREQIRSKRFRFKLPERFFRVLVRFEPMKLSNSAGL
jgi:hypothetical protein